MGFRDERHFSGNFRRTLAFRSLGFVHLVGKRLESNKLWKFVQSRCEARNYDYCAELGNHLKDLQMISFRVSQLEWLQSRSTR